MQRTPKGEGGALSSGWHQPLSGARFDALGVQIETVTKASYDITEVGAARCRMVHRIVVTRADGTAEITSDVLVADEREGRVVTARPEALWNGAPEATRRWRYEV